MVALGNQFAAPGSRISNPVGEPVGLEIRLTNPRKSLIPNASEIVVRSVARIRHVAGKGVGVLTVHGWPGRCRGSPTPGPVRTACRDQSVQFSLPEQSETRAKFLQTTDFLFADVRGRDITTATGARLLLHAQHDGRSAAVPQGSPSPPCLASGWAKGRELSRSSDERVQTLSDLAQGRRTRLNLTEPS